MKGQDEWEERPHVRNLWYSDPRVADKVSFQIHLRLYQSGSRFWCQQSHHNQQRMFVHIPKAVQY